ncbi:hypothetical protein BDR26DRAFT_854284 [Obelidium mucronatum]|nr:hypothetical protein BDR26DRAFT_854284 [Obelidium mucronatum]
MAVSLGDGATSGGSVGVARGQVAAVSKQTPVVFREPTPACTSIPAQLPPAKTDSSIPAQLPPAKTYCIACGDEASTKMPCPHYYCDSCAKTVCLNAIEDRSLFPAKCCKKEFPQEQVAKHLSGADMARYATFQKDLTGTSIVNLDPEFRKLVKDNGWQLCPKCGAGIEKIQDCGHMTCIICRFEFCYTCAAGWVPRKCKCDLWEPGVLDRILDARAPDVNPFERLRLRRVYERHDEHVHQWSKLDITDRYRKCYSCGWVCNQWYWRCEDCRTNSCGKCAFNRN